MPQDWEEFHLQPRQMAGMISHLWVFLTKTILIWLGIQGMNLNKLLEVLMRIKTQLSHMRCDRAPVSRCSLSRLPHTLLCPPFLISLLSAGSPHLSHTHSPTAHCRGGRFRCAAQVNLGLCHRQFNPHQLSPCTLEKSGLLYVWAD